MTMMMDDGNAIKDYLLRISSNMTLDSSSSAVVPLPADLRQGMFSATFISNAILVALQAIGVYHTTVRVARFHLLLALLSSILNLVLSALLAFTTLETGENGSVLVIFWGLDIAAVTLSMTFLAAEMQRACQGILRERVFAAASARSSTVSLSMGMGARSYPSNKFAGTYSRSIKYLRHILHVCYLGCALQILLWCILFPLAPSSRGVVPYWKQDAMTTYWQRYFLWDMGMAIAAIHVFLLCTHGCSSMHILYNEIAQGVRSMQDFVGTNRVSEVKMRVMMKKLEIGLWFGICVALAAIVLWSTFLQGVWLGPTYFGIFVVLLTVNWLHLWVVFLYQPTSRFNFRGKTYQLLCKKTEELGNGARFSTKQQQNQVATPRGEEAIGY